MKIKIDPWRLWLIRVAILLGMISLAMAAEGPKGPAPAGFNLGPFLAPFHMVVLHFPIGFLTLVAVFEVWAWRRPDLRLRQVIQLTLGLNLIAIFFTMLFGFLRAQGGEYQPSVLDQHRWWGIGSGVLALAAWWVHRGLVNGSASGKAALAFRGLLVAGLGCMVVAGHLGGSLTHGASFLTDNAPESLRRLLNEEKSPATATPVSGQYAAVRAILERRCFSCHGPEKQKGKYRMDEPKALVAGGKSGVPGIVPGDPAKGQVVRSLLLPRDHDEAMPPEGKEPVNAEELALIIKWIQAGAPTE